MMELMKHCVDEACGEGGVKVKLLFAPWEFEHQFCESADWNVRVVLVNVTGVLIVAPYQNSMAK